MNNEDVKARRDYRRKKARRKHLKTFFVFFLIFALLVGTVLSLTILFPIKNVKAKGSNLYESVHIEKYSNAKGKNFFMISSKQIEDSLRKKLPFVDSVKLKREFPDTVQIDVKDAKEFISYNVKGKYYTVSEKGYVLCEYEEPQESIINIEAKDVKCRLGKQVEFKQPKTKDTIDTIIKEIAKKDIAINSINITDRNNISVNIMNRFTILFGSSNYLQNKCVHLKGMIDNIDEGKKGTINLTMWTPEKSEGTFVKDN